MSPRRAAAPTERGIDLSAFKDELDRLGKEAFPRLAEDLQREMQGEFLDAALRIAPMGDRPKKRKTGMVGAGEFKRSIRAYPSPDAVQVGEPSYVASDAPHAQVLERGRKIGRSVKARKGRRGGRKRPEGKPRMMGSTQAPQGIFGPSIDAVDRKRESIMQGVIDRMESGA